ncbi:hypothetical protein SADUNF_Sadunf16G0245600 [Salix dunnii]|uniref:Uncharacterized protein n=1 Tax=Salix dunnii TaxID=1413687 RepID=A0A835JAA0_9ROSI|nr:hypothetical protein SADUNF_Sadunf16G0245600 [Salix dunnii]
MVGRGKALGSGAAKKATSRSSKTDFSSQQRLCVAKFKPAGLEPLEKSRSVPFSDIFSRASFTLASNGDPRGNAW